MLCFLIRRVSLITIIMSLFFIHTSTNANAQEIESSDTNIEEIEPRYSKVNVQGAEVSKTNILFYGNVDVSAFYTHKNRAITGKAPIDSFDIGINTEDTLFGVKFNYLKISALLELHPSDSFEDVFRRYFVSYNFTDDLSLKLGKDYTPSRYSEHFPQYAMNANQLMGFGTIAEIRASLASVSWKGLTFAVIMAGEPNVSFGGFPPELFQETQFLPRFEASYFLQSDNYDFKVYGGYSNYQFRFYPAPDSEFYNSRNIDSYHLGIGGMYDFGLVYIAGSLFAGQNISIWGGLYDINRNFTDTEPVYDRREREFDSILTISGALALGFEFNSLLKAHIGGGYTVSTRTLFESGKPSSQYSAFINMPITVTQYFEIIPEISVVEQPLNSSGVYSGAEFYGGVYFRAKIN